RPRYIHELLNHAPICVDVLGIHGIGHQPLHPQLGVAVPVLQHQVVVSPPTTRCGMHTIGIKLDERRFEHIALPFNSYQALPAVKTGWVGAKAFFIDKGQEISTVFTSKETTEKHNVEPLYSVEIIDKATHRGVVRQHGHYDN